MHGNRKFQNYQLIKEHNDVTGAIAYFYTNNAFPRRTEPHVIKSQGEKQNWVFSRTVGGERIDLTIENFDNALNYLKKYVEVTAS